MFEQVANIIGQPTTEWQGNFLYVICGVLLILICWALVKMVSWLMRV